LTGAIALGFVSIGRQWGPSPGQAHRGEAGRGRLSLQKHHHRSEHWIMMRGTARVTVNELV
jgi:mannose-6-phosphate isomerase-like protein (cupin superfamily)